MTLQIAISKFFDGEAPDPLEEARASAQSQSPPRSESHRETLLDRSGSFTSQQRPSRGAPAPRVVPQRPEQTRWRPPLVLSILFTPLNVLYRLFANSFSLFTYIFPFLARPSRPNTLSSPPNSSIDRSTSTPRETALRTIASFKQQYGETPALPFFEDGYAQAYDLAKRDLKFLLVILLSVEHDDTAHFVQNTLRSPTVTSFVNDPNNKIVLWLGDVQDSEAYQVSTALDCTKLPFTALIVHTPQSGSTAMTTVGRIGGPVSASNLVSRLSAAIAACSPALERVRATRTEQQASRNLREAQNSAYERSLAQDRERARQKKEAENEKQQLARNAQAEAQRLARQKEWADEWKRQKVRTIKPEPGPENKECTRISIRMPSGERVVRRFLVNTTFEELYTFVECQAISNTTTSPTSETSIELPASYEYQYGFKLVSPLPRTVYEASDTRGVGSAIGRSGNLIVEPIQGDEEEDDND